MKSQYCTNGMSVVDQCIEMTEAADLQDPEYIEAVRQLFYWQFTSERPEDATSFSGRLYTLIGKAQSTPSNWNKLLKGFPYEVKAWVAWSRAGNNGHDLFAKFNLFPTNRETDFREGLAKTHKEKKGESETENFNSWIEKQKNLKGG